MGQSVLIQKIKRKIPKGRKVYLNGHYQDDNRYFLWWYVHKENGVVWIEFETDRDPTGRMAQQACDFEPELLQSVLDSMTGDTVSNSLPVGCNRY